MEDPSKLNAVLGVVFDKWINHADNPQLIHFVRDEMGAYPPEMWARAARVIGAAYQKNGNPLSLLAKESSAPRVLHLYAQPDDPSYFAAQEDFGKKNAWFSVKKVSAQNHFPMFEVPEVMSNYVTEFVKGK
jgi:hypothetical protein